MTPMMMSAFISSVLQEFNLLLPFHILFIFLYEHFWRLLNSDVNQPNRFMLTKNRFTQVNRLLIDLTLRIDY